MPKCVKCKIFYACSFTGVLKSLPDTTYGFTLESKYILSGRIGFWMAEPTRFELATSGLTGRFLLGTCLYDIV